MVDFGVGLVEVTDFGPFVGTHAWNLGKESGLFNLKGINHANPRLSSNGVGKSSLLNAITYCLYDRTTRLLRGNDVVNYNARSCRVRVDIYLDNEQLTIIRSRNPNTLTLNGNNIDQDALVKAIRFNLDSFLSTVIIPQFGESFLDLKPSEKLSLFTEIMELDHWLDLSRRASDKANIIKNNINLCENEISRLKGRKETINSIIDDLKKKSDQWASEQESKIKDIEKYIGTLNSNIKQFETELNLFSKETHKLSKEIESIDKEIKKKEDELNGFNSEISEARKEMSILDHKISEKEKIFISLSTLGPICNVCKQKVDSTHLSSELKKVKKEVKTLDAELKDLMSVFEEIKKDKGKATDNFSFLDEKRRKLKKELQSGENKSLSMASDLRYLKRDLKKNIELLKEELGKKNEFDILIDDRINENEEIDEKVKVKESKLDVLNQEHAAISYWVSGFKQLRLFIVEETLETLKVEVNNSLTSLGMIGWEISFDVEKENRSGGVTKGFNTIIKDPNGKEIKYESLSGGEGQRIRLAVTFGLSNLICERAGLTIRNEFYDETSQHLSEEGIEDMLSTLRDRAINYNRKIVVIDHHSFNSGNFDGGWKVIKDNTGSRIEVGT